MHGGGVQMGKGVSVAFDSGVSVGCGGRVSVSGNDLIGDSESEGD